LAAPLALLLFLSCSVILGRKLDAERRAVFTEKTQDRAQSASFRWNPDLFRILSFGHVPSAVDALLLRFITDNNMTKVDDSVDTEAYRVLDLATDLDPAFFALYNSGSNYLVVVRNDRKGAIALVEKGRDFLRNRLPAMGEEFRARHWARAWLIPFIRGYLYLFEYQNASKGAEAYAEAVEYPDVPPAVRKLAEHARTPDGQFNLGINSISILRNFVKEDEAALRSLDEKEKILITAREIYNWNLGFVDYRQREPLQTRWQRFRDENRIPERDRMGGRIFVRADGRIDTETPKASILGIDVANLIHAVEPEKGRK
jgi:hypothetical protein